MELHGNYTHNITILATYLLISLILIQSGVYRESDCRHWGTFFQGLPAKQSPRKVRDHAYGIVINLKLIEARYLEVQIFFF